MTKRAVIISFIGCFLLSAITHGAVLAEYDADAGTPVENPSVQGWAESGTGSEKEIPSTR